MITIEDLDDATRDELLGKVIDKPGPTSRRREVYARWLAMTEQHEKLVEDRIRELFNQNEVILEMVRFSTALFNPLRRIANKVAVAYKSPPRRRLDGASDEVNRRFVRMLKDARFNVKARTWNLFQVGMNTIVVLVKPARRNDGTMVPDYIVINGADGEVVPDPEAPFEDAPGILAYPLPDVDPLAWRHTDEEREVAVTVDGKWWVFWNGQREAVRVVEHRLGRFPGSVLRGTDPLVQTPDGWWDPMFGRGVMQSVAEAGVAAATMQWTRKTQFGKLITVLRDPDRSPLDSDDGNENLIGHPEAPLELIGENIRLLVNELNTGIGNFREHIKYLTEEGAEVMTGASSALVDPEPGMQSADFAEARKHSALRERQEMQVEGLDVFEHDFLPLVAKLCRQIGNPNAVEPERVKDSLEVEFSALPFLDTPIERLKYFVLATKFGVLDQVDWGSEVWGVDEQTAHERVLEKAARRAELHKLLSVHNQPADPMDEENEIDRPEMPGERPEARTGRAGGVQSPPEPR